MPTNAGTGIIATTSSAGTSNNPTDADLRILRIEASLGTRLAANADATLLPRTQANPSIPPQIRGISAVSTSQRIFIQWSASPVLDLSFYEIQVSTQATFTSAVPTFRYTERRPFFSFDEGASGAPYFVRVRAWNKRNIPGPWSDVVNSLTGMTTTMGQMPVFSNWVPASIGRFINPDIFDPTIGDPVDETGHYQIGSIPLQAQKTIPFMEFNFKVQSYWYVPGPPYSFAPENNLTVTFFENYGTPSQLTRGSYIMDFFSIIGYGGATGGYVSSRQTISGIIPVFTPLAGDHTYDLELQVKSGPQVGLYLEPLTLDLQYVQVG